MTDITRLGAAVAVLVFLGGLVGCSSAGTDGDAPAGTSSPVASPSSPVASPSSPGPPESPAPTDLGGLSDALAARLAFVLGLLDGAALDEATYAEAFAPTFRDQVPLDAFTPTLDQLVDQGPWTLDGQEPTSSGLEARVQAADGSAVVVILGVDAQGRIDSLLLQPGDVPELETPLASLDDAIDRLEDLGTLRLAAARVEGTSCTTLRGVAADQQAPIGSAFKLYVLGALVDAIDDGRLSWDDELVITESDKSLPSGVLQAREAGTTVTVAEAAELMISISDNTATDLVIQAVGRDAVESAQADWGHREPGRNVPFPTTREFFQLKAADDELQQRWVDGGEADRRAILDELSDDDLPTPDLFADGPVRPDELEWFASPEDLCRVLAGLADRLGDPGMEPLATALTANPGPPPDDPDQWDTILFKGGSEPGLIAMAFLVVDDQGATFVVTGSVVDPSAPLDDATAILLFAGARDLVATADD